MKLHDEEIRVNGLLFCGHGFEFCNHCATDLRTTNDHAIKGELDNWSSMSKEDMLDDMMRSLMNPSNRKSLSVEGRVVNTGQRVPSDANSAYIDELIWACKEHDKADCKICFNWPKLIRQAEVKKERGLVEDRDMLLGLLNSMGVEFPTNTKLSTDVFEKKLTSALNFAQDIANFSEQMPVNPTVLPRWEGESVFDSVRRGNIQEAMQNWNSVTQGRGFSTSPLYENAFIDVRQTVMHLGKNFDEGRSTFVLQDKDQQEALCIRILDVYRLGEKTPLILLSYASQTAHEPITKTLDFIQAQMNAGYVAHITCTRQEQAILRRLLYINSTKVAAAYNAGLKPYENEFQITFLLPVGPLAQVDIGKLTNDPGCALCGKKTTSRCSSCLSVHYCSPECQRAHWKEHRSFCRSIRGGTWRTLSFSDHIVFDGQRMYSSIISNTSSKLNSVGKKHEEGKAPANVHGDRAFLVKLQRPLGPIGMGILVYDRTRSFSGHINRAKDPGAYDQAMQYMPPGGALKIYRWAKRIGDWDLSICLDREPEGTLQW
ncbi:hypothetical protein K488DRAFT_48696 [Vararia minispora EC-137]|uniref:Uncharacterized protein n=1 Tax=Vararia minispora EC-137 TaxID=1314806 RepID=A0ACB8QM90_9AGAM|nr:hypothetical protein K488DRAFT_48696 [Vararia minispora EC-137]